MTKESKPTQAARRRYNRIAPVYDLMESLIGKSRYSSVPDPVRGLMEVESVCKPGGKVLLLEHVLSANRILAWLMNLANPIVLRVMGPNINRQTVENVINNSSPGKSGHKFHDGLIIS